MERKIENRMENMGKEPAKKEAVGNPVEHGGMKRPENGKYVTIPEVLLQQTLRNEYLFRYNVLTEQTEYKRKNDCEDFRMLDKRHTNTLCLELMEQGIRCWDKDVHRFIHSSRIEDFHPFMDYMDDLPKWDGKDRIEPLIRRITNDSICIKGMYYWLMAMVAQWMGKDRRISNSLVPLLISEEQGLGKSTFCRYLLPPELRGYYTDMVELTAKGRIGQRLVQNGLINLDEFDRIPANRMPYLKNIIQVKDVSMNKAYTGYFSSLPRIASFIGTSNRTDLLTDPTGSRRFICIMIEKMIDNSPIHYNQLYAEVKWFIDAGERTYLTHEEEEELQKHNLPFQRTSLGLSLFNECFVGGEGKNGEWMDIHQIIAHLARTRSIAHTISPFVLSRELLRVGIRKEHRYTGNYYYVQLRSGGRCAVV